MNLPSLFIEAVPGEVAPVKGAQIGAGDARGT